MLQLMHGSVACHCHASASPTFATKNILPQKCIWEQRVNKKYDNIKPKQPPVLKKNTDDTTAAVKMMPS